MPYDFEADALLLRAILGTAAHDLGGVASALALRADVLAASLSADDVAALRGVVDHLRAVGRQLRRLRGSAGGSSFVPAREKTLTEWCALLERFGAPLLGRGIELRASCNEGAISAETEQALTYGMLALFQALREGREEREGTRVVVTLRAEASTDALVVTVQINGDTARGDDRWRTHARSVVTAASLAWEALDEGELRISGRP